MFQISLQKHSPTTLSHLPLLLKWYQRVRELPIVSRPAKDCGMALLSLGTADPFPSHPEPPLPIEAEQKSPTIKQEPFIGGPRPTLTKLQVIEFLFRFSLYFILLSLLFPSIFYGKR